MDEHLRHANMKTRQEIEKAVAMKAARDASPWPKEMLDAGLEPYQLLRPDVKAQLEKAIRRRWRKVGRKELTHDDGSRIYAYGGHWYLMLPDGKVRGGPCLFAETAKDLHIIHSQP
jgi:hypothetical protein